MTRGCPRYAARSPAWTPGTGDKFEVSSSERPSSSRGISASNMRWSRASTVLYPVGGQNKMSPPAPAAVGKKTPNDGPWFGFFLIFFSPRYFQVLVKDKDHYFKILSTSIPVSFSRFVIPTSCPPEQHEPGELLRFSKKQKKKEALCPRKGASVTRDPRQEERRVHTGWRKAEKTDFLATAGPQPLRQCLRRRASEEKHAEKGRGRREEKKLLQKQKRNRKH